MPFFNPLLDDREFSRMYVKYEGCIEDIIKVFVELSKRREELLLRKKNSVIIATRSFSCKIYFNGKLVKLNDRVIKAVKREAEGKRPYKLPVDLVIEVRYEARSKWRKLRRNVVAVRVKKTRKGAYLMYAAERASLIDPRLIIREVASMLRTRVTESLSATS